MRAAVALIWESIAETLHPPAGDGDGLLVPLLVLLTLVTGIVDAVAYLALGHVFVANMTGNVVFLGFGLAGAGGLSIAGSLLAIGCFLPGGVLAGRITGARGGSRLAQLSASTAVEALLVVAATVIAATTGPTIASADRYVMIALLALAGGVQNATARHLAVADLTTTVLTLTLTGIAADSHLAGGTGRRSGRRLIAVVAMALGALLGAVLLLQLAPVASLLSAGAILVAVAIGAHRGARREPAVAE